VSDGAFLGYIALLFASAVLLSILAIGGFGQSKGARIIDGILAAAFLAYAVYLLVFFQGGNVRIFLYAFLVPIFAVVRMVRERKARREAAAQTAQAGYAQTAQPGYAQPAEPGYAQPAQPGYGQPAQPGYGQPSAQGQPVPQGQPAQSGAVPPAPQAPLG
jgi:hypothetical protein